MIIKTQTIVFVTIDVGNSNALKPVAEKARAHGHHVMEFYGQGKLFPDETITAIQNNLYQADWLIVSLSSSEEKARMEGTFMSFATKNAVKILILSDIDGMMYRSRWCKWSARKAHTVTVVNESEVACARQYVRSTTRIVHVPNPSWISNFNVTKQREEVRCLLQITPDAMLLVLPFDKEIERNIVRLTMVVKAINIINTKLHVVVTPHPGADHSIDVFKRLVTYSKHPITFSIQKESGVSTQEALSACDIALMGNGTANAYTAACLRTPQVCVIDPLVDLQYWKDLSGQDSWSIADMGASALAQNAESLQRIITGLCDQGNAAMVMLQIQERKFSRSVLEGATDRVLTLLEK